MAKRDIDQKPTAEDIASMEASEMPASVDDAAPGTRARGPIYSPQVMRDVQALSRKFKSLDAAQDRRDARSAAQAARPPMVKPIPINAVGKMGTTRDVMVLDIPVGMSREDALKPEALRLVAALPTLHRSEKPTLGLGAIGSRFEVQAEDLSWGETWLIVKHVPSLNQMAVWPVPGTLWQRPVELIEVPFEGYTFRDGGIHGWRIYRGDVVMADQPFASPDMARSYVLTTLRERIV